MKKNNSLTVNKNAIKLINKHWRDQMIMAVNKLVSEHTKQCVEIGGYVVEVNPQEKHEI